MENFEDMVGHSEPLEVKITHFNPDDEMDEEKDESNFIYEDEKRKHEDVEVIYADDQIPDVGFKNENELSALDRKIDFVEVHDSIFSMFHLQKTNKKPRLCEDTAEGTLIQFISLNTEANFTS